MFGYVAGALAYLPLPSAFALSTSLQKRVVQYVLKVALGKLIKDGDLKLDQIEAEISSGLVEIRKVHLDVEYINSFLSHSGVQLKYGLIGSISISIPWSNPLGGDVTVTVNGVDVEVCVGAAPANVQKAFESLGESILSAAEDAIDDEGDDGKELEESMASLVDDPDAHSSEGQSGASGLSVFLALQANNIFARTKMSISNVLFRLRNDSVGSKKDIEIQLRIDDLRFLTDPDADHTHIKRTLTLGGLSVWIDNGEPSREPAVDDDDASSSSDASSTWQGEERYGAEKSMAASVYASAMGIESIYQSSSSSRANLSSHRPMRETGPQLLARIGEEPVKICFSTTTGAHAASTAETASAHHLQLSVECDKVFSLITPISASSLLRFLADCQATFAQIRTMGNSSESRASKATAQTGLDLSFSLGQAHLLLAYAFSTHLDDRTYETYRKTTQEFWNRPASTCPHINHLRIRASSIVAEAQLGEAKTACSVSSDDLAVYECMASKVQDSSHNRTRIMPILVFDQNLPDRIATARSKQSTCISDWRDRSGIKTKADPYIATGFSSNGWKLSGAANSGKTATKTQQSSALSLTYSTVKRQATSLVIACDPIHLFFDTSTALRLLPCTQWIGTGIARAGHDTHSLARSTANIQARDSMRRDETENANIRITCPLVRFELRAHQDEEVDDIGETDGSQTRSGVIAVDLISPKVTHSPSLRGKSTLVHFAHQSSSEAAHTSAVGAEVHQKTILAMTEGRVSQLSPQGVMDVTFASFSPLQSDDVAEAAIRPSITFRTERTLTMTESVGSIDSVLPSLQLQLSKDILYDLELLADDLSLWSARIRAWHEQVSAERATDALRILGSRFFGSRHSYSTLSDSSASTEMGRDRLTNAPTFNMQVHEAMLRLLLPASQDDQANSRKGTAASEALICTANEISLQFDGQHTETSSSIRLVVESLSVKHSARQDAIVEQTLRNSLRQVQQPMLVVHVVSTAERDTSFRGSSISVSARNLLARYDGDPALMRQLLAFAKAPEGIFEHVEPNEVTRLALRFEDTTVLLTPKQSSARAAIVIEDMAVKSKVISDYPRSAIRLSLANASVYVGEKLLEKDDAEVRARRITEFWQSKGLTKIVHAKDIEAISTRSNLTLPEVELQVTRGHVDGYACADTGLVLQAIVADFERSNMPPKKALKKRSHVDLQQQQDMSILREIEDDTYVRMAEDVSDVDLLEDDVPSHLNAYGEKVVGSAARGATILQNDLVTVRLLDTQKGILPQKGFFSDPHLHLAPKDSRSINAPNLRLSVRNVDLSLRLHAGFDCESTRKAIEDEAKRVRRRLQRIKQMLDQGQTPDDSVEEVAATLFDSIHISLPKGRTAGDLNAAELIQVVDEELDDQTETASTASTWKQFVPGRVGSPNLSSKRKRSKLARSKDAMIEFNLKGVQMDYDAFGEQANVQSRLDVRVRTIRILDHIKTSTWQTFLTGMTSSSSMRTSAKSDMLRVELTSVLSSTGRTDNELRCKLRVSPLRLHVDQDALDFLKKFFMLEIPGTKPDEQTASASTESGPFIQHAEVFAIMLKLDYKPKRVDYRLLRQGKTIEMMNFFNFEGSEITLRHITLRGVMGWPTLFDMLNDMWTPDVKANQLADVLSGITPIRSLVNVGNGMADLILLPIEHYQRDGRFARGLREGAKRFVKTTALEAARMGARLATGTQVILEQTEHVLGGGDRQMDEQRGVVTEARNDEQDSDSEIEREPDRISRYASQPETMRQALSEAQRGLRRGFNEAAQTILAVPMEVYDRQSGQGRGKPVIRAVPIAVLRGAAGASEALSKTLQGIQRELTGSQRAAGEEDEAKYKRPAEQR